MRLLEEIAILQREESEALESEETRGAEAVTTLAEVQSKLASNLFELGLRQQGQGRFDEAAVSYERAESKAGENEQLKLAAIANRAGSLFQAGVPKDILAGIFREALQTKYNLDLLDRGRLLSLGLLNRVAGDWRTSQTCYEEVLPSESSRSSSVYQWDEKSLDALLGLAGLSIDRGRYAAAKQHLDLVKEKYPGAEKRGLRVLLTRVDLAIAQGELKEASELLEVAEDAFLEDADVAYRSGVVAAKQDKTNQAEGYFLRALAFRPGFARAISALTKLRAAVPKEAFPGQGWRVAIGIGLVVAAAGILLYAAWPLDWDEPEKASSIVTQTVTELSCIEGGSVDACPADKTSFKTTTTQTETPVERARLTGVDASYLAVVGALAAAGFVAIFWRKFKSFDAGPLSLELGDPAPPPGQVTP
jgi:tetratricopeptide (TPR) repeat protein